MHHSQSKPETDHSIYKKKTKKTKQSEADIYETLNKSKTKYMCMYWRIDLVNMHIESLKLKTYSMFRTL